MHLSPFAEELVKLALGPQEHTYTSGLAAEQMGMSPSMRKGLARGSHKIDSSVLSHPYNPTSDLKHNFGGTTTPRQVGADIARRQSRGAADIALSQTDKSLVGRLKSPVRLARGMRRIGGGEHTTVDRIHRVKPGEAGIESGARQVMPQGKGYGGGIAAGREHAKSGLTFGPGGPAADLDKLEPQKFQSDRQAISNAKGYGRASLKKVKKQMIAQGLNPEEAAKRTSAVMAGEHPGRVATGIADVSHGLQDIKHEGKRLVETAKQTPGALLRRARDGRLSSKAREVANAARTEAPGLVRGAARGIRQRILRR